jgi:tRNA (adenine22-N1)-methyltransferase
MKTRLGKRLKALFDAIPPGYDTVWDLCCDHGRLGLALLESQRTGTVHFIDQVASIMDDLQVRLERYGATGYQVQTIAAERLALPPDERALLVLAGVGDEVTLAIVNALSAQNPDCPPDWLISPANSLFQVRRGLQQQEFGLLEEGVVFENGRGYEWMRVCQDRHRAPIAVSNPASFWNAQLPEHRAHLQKLVRHARQQQHNPNQQDAGPMLALYEPLLTERLQSPEA